MFDDLDDPDLHATQGEQWALYLLQRDFGYTYQQYMNDPPWVAVNLLDRHHEMQSDEDKRDEQKERPRSRIADDEWLIGGDLKLI